MKNSDLQPDAALSSESAEPLNPQVSGDAANAALARGLGRREQEVMKVLWARGSASVLEVAQCLTTTVAYTTVMTTLDRLFKKGLLTRSEEGRAFRYAPQLSREELHREAAGHAFRQLLDASPASTLPLSFLVEILGERDTQLLDDLRKLVERKRRELGQKTKGPKEKE